VKGLQLKLGRCHESMLHVFTLFTSVMSMSFTKLLIERFGSVRRQIALYTANIVNS
jgi:hypothetical protein